jgi:hypothetical protein
MRLLLPADRNLTDAPALVPAEAGTQMTDWIPAISAFTRVFDALCAGMNGGAVLDRSRVAASALVGQTQSRERNHARVSFRFLYS